VGVSILYGCGERFPDSGVPRVLPNRRFITSGVIISATPIATMAGIPASPRAGRNLPRQLAEDAAPPPGRGIEWIDSDPSRFWESPREELGRLYSRFVQL